MKMLRLVPVMLLLLSGALAGSSAAADDNGHSHAYVCSGGNIPSGSYDSVLVTGVCFIPSGTVAIDGNLTVAPGALLDAVTRGSGLPLPGTVTVGGNVRIGSGAVLGLGCNSETGCPTGQTHDIVHGNLTGLGALGVIVHATTIDGNASLVGGGGGPALLPGGPGTNACFAITPPLWGEDPSLGAAVYSAFEDNTIGGNLHIIGLQSCWMGALRNTIGGNVLVVGNTMGDADANEVVQNTISGNINCLGNNPVIEYGDSGASPNLVQGNAHGQCGFNVLQPDPNLPPGTPRPISVKVGGGGDSDHS